ncbi:MAG TPA: hypothetical protein VI387_07890 [Candidatus Brocadiales bacterium]|nr:hypothetical protein [Candidatus Brocadiales bacterium]
MASYKPRKIVAAVYIGILIFLISISFFLYILHGDFYILGVMSVLVVFALMFALIPLPEVITDADGVIKKRFGKVCGDCHWDWIFDVKTFRLSTGTYSTLLSYSEDPAQRSNYKSRMVIEDPKGGVFTVSAAFNDYESFLKEVKEKAINAQFDKTTEKIIEEGMQPSILRVLGWGVAALFFIGVLVYLILNFTS